MTFVTLCDWRLIRIAKPCNIGKLVISNSNVQRYIVETGWSDLSDVSTVLIS